MFPPRLESWAFTRNYAFSLAGTIIFFLGAINFAVWLFVGLVSTRHVNVWSNTSGLIFNVAIGARFMINTAWLRRERRKSAERDGLDAG